MKSTLFELHHPMCRLGAEQWIDGLITTKYFVWVCNMVHSDNIGLYALLGSL